jgi:hypothetical protein
LTPPQLAQRWAVSADKILYWIHSGQLRAVNLALNPGGRPRWRIDPADALAFEQRRSSGSPPPQSARRRKKVSGVIEFF